MTERLYTPAEILKLWVLWIRGRNTLMKYIHMYNTDKDNWADEEDRRGLRNIRLKTLSVNKYKYKVPESAIQEYLDKYTC